jgi:hypothetical protein
MVVADCLRVASPQQHRTLNSGESLNTIANIVVALACIGGTIGMAVGVWLMFRSDTGDARTDADVLVGAAIAFGAFFQALIVVCVFRAIAVFGRYVAWRASDAEL